MVIHNLDIEAVPPTPFEAEAPLVVDADAVLPLAVSVESFQAVTGDQRKIRQADRRVEGFQLAPSRPLEGLEAADEPILEESLCVPASEGLDHRRENILTKRNCQSRNLPP